MREPKSLSPEQLARFWAKVVRTQSGCWLWSGSVSPFGHGVVRIDRALYRAHRISWVCHHGVIPRDRCVLHRCDVAACVNPAHLFLGSKADNTADMVAKGRARHIAHRGEQNGSAKLTASQVAEIRSRFGPPTGKGTFGRESQSKLAREFGVSQTLISAVVRKEIWR